MENVHFLLVSVTWHILFAQWNWTHIRISHFRQPNNYKLSPSIGLGKLFRECPSASSSIKTTGRSWYAAKFWSFQKTEAILRQDCRQPRTKFLASTLPCHPLKSRLTFSTQRSLTSVPMAHLTPAMNCSWIYNQVLRTVQLLSSGHNVEL